MRIGVLQYSPIFGNKEGNHARVLEMLSGERDALIVLPELCFTGYVFKNKEELKELSEEINGPTVERLSEIARTNNLFLAFGIAEKVGERLYNSSFLLSPDGSVEVYRKAHLFNTEKLFFTPGDTGFPVFDVKLGRSRARIGLLVCFDWIFPEPWRILALKGAQIIAHSTNLVLPYCQDAAITRAIENRLFIATSNRTGEEHGLRFTGISQIVSPKGKIMVRLGERIEGVWTVECDIEEANDKMVTERNDIIADRREDLYHLKEK